VSEVALHELASRTAGSRPRSARDTEPDINAEWDASKLDLTSLGRMTATVIDLVSAILARTDHAPGAAGIPPRAEFSTTRQ